MASEPEKKPKPSPEDPRLKRFLRRAVPIIAAERGINERSLIRIRAIADDLRLPNELYQTGLRKLKKIGVGQKLTRYEREFNRFLRREFKNLSGGILTGAVEQKALEIATKKYQIPVERAREIIMERSVKQNIGRISRSEAETHVEQSIADRVGKSTIVDAETRQRFYLVGKEWGVERDRVDSMVEQVLAQNRENRARPSRSMPIYLPFLAASILVVGISGYFWWRGQSADPGQGNAVPREDVEKPIVFPGWWPEDLKLSAAKMRSDLTGFGPILENLVSPDSANRLAGYRKLANELVEGKHRDTSKARIRALLIELVKKEPEEAEPQVVEAITGRILMDDLPDDAEQLRLSFLANEEADKILRVLLPSSKLRLALAERMEAKTGVPVDQEYLDSSRVAMAESYWRILDDLAWTNPDRAARLYPMISEGTQRKLPESTNRMRNSNWLFALLESAPDKISQAPIQDRLNYTLEKTKPEALVRWIDLAQATESIPLRDWLESTLARRLQVSRTTEATVDWLGQLRRKATGSLPGEKTLIARKRAWLNKYRNSLSIRPIAANSKITAQQLNDVSHFATLDMMFQSKRLPEWMPQIDEKLDSGPEQLDADIPILKDGVIFRRVSRRTARNWELQAKSDLIKRIGDENDSDNLRINALKQLALLNTKISDLSPEEARVVAAFCLSIQDRTKQLDVQSSLERMASWLNVSLAFAQEIYNEEMEQSEILWMLETLSGQRFSVEEDDWRNRLRKRYMTWVSSRLDRSRKAGADTQAWELFADAFHQQCLERSLAMGVSPDLVGRCQSTTQLQLTLLLEIEHPDWSDEQSWEQLLIEQKALRQLSRRPLEQVVLLETRLIDQLLESAPGTVNRELLEQFRRQRQLLSTVAQKFYLAEYFYCQFARQRQLSESQNEK